MSEPASESSTPRGQVRITPAEGWPGRVLPAPEPIVPELGERTTAVVHVHNHSAWPVVVTSHFHFFEANRHLEFDRSAAFGMRLDLPAGESVRFDPGVSGEVALVSYAGERAVYGFNGLTNATLSDGRFEEHRAAALTRLRAAGFRDSGV
ncbi:MAG: urease subunit beta [Pseudonocardiales bacterium]|jgi:urease beta subunit|nr:urease subunit beta [Pseudonocardiales bacterium]